MLDYAVLDKFGDLEFTEEERRVLAKRLLCIFSAWGLAKKEQSMVLGLKEDDQSSIDSFADSKPGVGNCELLWRIGYILAIFRLLRSFDIDRPDRADRWISTPNAFLGGAKPIEIMKNPEGLITVRGWLETYGSR